MPGRGTEGSRSEASGVPSFLVAPSPASSRVEASTFRPSTIDSASELYERMSAVGGCCGGALPPRLEVDLAGSDGCESLRTGVAAHRVDQLAQRRAGGNPVTEQRQPGQPVMDRRPRYQELAMADVADVSHRTASARHRYRRDGTQSFSSGRRDREAAERRTALLKDRRGPRVPERTRRSRRAGIGRPDRLASGRRPR